MESITIVLVGGVFRIVTEEYCVIALIIIIIIIIIIIRNL